MSERGKKQRVVGKTVRYEFSEAELADIAASISSTLAQVDDLEADKKAAMSDYGNRIKEAKAALSKMARHHREGYEMREVPCLVEYDYEKERVNYIRKDTGEVADSRAMSEDERQLYFKQACARCGEMIPMINLTEVNGEYLCGDCLGVDVDVDDEKRDKTPRKGKTLPADKFECSVCGQTLPMEELAAETNDALICKSCDRAGADQTGTE